MQRDSFWGQILSLVQDCIIAWLLGCWGGGGCSKQEMKPGDKNCSLCLSGSELSNFYFPVYFIYIKEWPFVSLSSCLKSDHWNIWYCTFHPHWKGMAHRCIQMILHFNPTCTCNVSPAWPAAYSSLRSICVPLNTPKFRHGVELWFGKSLMQNSCQQIPERNRVVRHKNKLCSWSDTIFDSQ